MDLVLVGRQADGTFFNLGLRVREKRVRTESNRHPAPSRRRRAIDRRRRCCRRRLRRAHPDPRRPWPNGWHQRERIWSTPMATILHHRARREENHGRVHRAATTVEENFLHHSRTGPAHWRCACAKGRISYGRWRAAAGGEDRTSSLIGCSATTSTTRRSIGTRQPLARSGRPIRSGP